MRQMKPVLWTKGVLLTPQHLQTQDRFLEELLRFQLAALTVCPWGFHRLEIERAALASGTFALGAASAIFPDGLLLDAPGADPLPGPRPLDACWAPDQQTLDVYLAVPERRPDAALAAPDGRDRGARYVAEVELRRDETNGLTERPVQVARKNVRLLVEGEPLDGHTTLRLARVRRAPAGGYELDPRMVPPLLDVGASPVIVAALRRLIELLTAKSATLAGSRRQRNQSLADFGASDVAQFWLLYTVNAHLPTLRHACETRRGHPELLWNELVALAGALSTFAPSAARPLPTYDHDDPGPAFAELDLRLRELLETAVPVNCVSLPLRPSRPSIQEVALHEEGLLVAPQLFLAVKADVPRAELLQKVPTHLKLCSADHIEHLIRQALPGVPLAHVPVPPSAIPVKLDYQYFALSRTGGAWEAVTRARNLAAYVPADLPNAQLELVVVLPRS